jgi:hypothetical protein
MSCLKPRFRHISTSIVLASELAIAFNMTIAIAPGTATMLHQPEKLLVSQQANKQSIPPPPPTNPGSSAAGGRRASTACPQDAIEATASPSLTALSPTTKTGLTLAAHPTFLVYVPKTSAEAAEFTLRTPAGQGVYRTTIDLTNTPDVISITLPNQTTPLEVGKPYTWSFAVICNPDDRLSDQFVTGMVQRTELESARLSQIEQAPLRQRIALYQEDSIWYDALALLFESKRSQPNLLEIDTIWRDFLQSGGVDTMINIIPAIPR